MKVRAYTEADAVEWDDVVGRCACGTFLGTRRFLAYHGGRFTDLSLVCEDDKGRLAAVLPAALKPDDDGCVASHPGATYGGLLCREGRGADEVGEMLAGAIGHYRSRGLRRLEYKSVPPHLHATYLQADVHALWRNGAELVRRDLWNVLALGAGPPACTSHHQRAIARARKGGVVARVATSDADYAAFHRVLETRLDERYGVTPVHTLDEMLLLKDRFPREIALWLAHDGDGGGVLAGCWVFMHAGRAWHTQYIASTAQGRERCATHLLFDALIQEAVRGRIAFLSFGCSTEDGGRQVNSGLFDFKTGFGAGAVCHDIYQLRLA